MTIGKMKMKMKQYYEEETEDEVVAITRGFMGDKHALVI